VAKRLISFEELDRIEGLVEAHRQIRERLGTLEADAAEFDGPMQSALELSRKADGLKSELVAMLEQLRTRIVG